MRYIILLLLLTSTISAQTKWRQIERSLTKWQVPAAYDSIPGVTGYASKYITLQTLIDTLGITSGVTGSSDDGNVAYWLADTLTGDTAHYWDRTNKRLGLNTKTPESLLHVKKNEFALPVAEFDNPGTNGKTVVIKHGANTDGRYPLQITTPAGSSYFDARGYLGLGVSPSYPLHVKNSSGISRFENTNSNGDAGFDLYHSSKWWRIAMNAEGGTTNNIHFRDITGSRYPLTLQSSNGYVGILNITPGRELDVTGRVRVSTLDTDGSAPTTNGTTKMIITDGNGDLSFANIPTSPIDSTSIIGGWGIEAVESPANTWNLVADTTQVATQYDLSQKNTDLTLSGTTTVTINSSTGSDVTLTQGSGVTFTRSGNDLTIASTGGGGGIDSTSLVGGWGVNVSESPANTWNVSADTAEVATQYDLTLKQDKLVSGTNIKTINSTTLLGSGNITAVTSVGTSAPLTGGTITGTGTIGLSYDNTYMGLDGSNQLYPRYNIATWNAYQLRGSSIATPFSPTSGDVLTYNGSAWAPAAPSGGISGGTTNYITKFTSVTTIGNSQLQDNGTTVGLGVAPDASYKFKVGSGNMKIGDATAGTLNKLYFGDGTFVYVGEDVADDRLYLKGGTLSISAAGSLGTNGQVLTSNGTTASWVTPNLTYSGTTSPITLQTSGNGSNVRFLAGTNITLSRSGTDMTISAAGGGGTPGTGTAGQVTFWTAPSGVPTLSGSSSFFWDNGNVRLGLGTAAPTRLLDVNGSARLRSIIYDSNNNGGNIGDKITSNGVGAWYWSTDGIYAFCQIERSSSANVSIGTSYTNVDFNQTAENIGHTVDLTNDIIEPNVTGKYEITFNALLNGAGSQVVTFTLYINGVATNTNAIDLKSANENRTISFTTIENINAFENVEVKVYRGTSGSGTDVNYAFPRLILKRLN